MRVFDIQDTSKHAKGFTLYKIVSIVYPKSCPDAVTKITVWKRYNDFKKLHRELKLRHKSMHIEEKFPNLPNSSFFKRFETEIISQRKTSILAFLEYVALHPSLFKSIEFVKFFETSHTPQEALNSNINIIRAQLNLPNDPEVIFANNSDDDFGHSDSDSISTFSVTSTSVLPNDDLSMLENRSNSSLTNSNPLQSSCTSLSSTRLAPDRPELVAPSCNNVYPTPPTTPEVTTSQEAMDPTQYINTATTHIEKGTALELEQKFEEAFDIYKLGISIFLKGVKGDVDKNRRQMVKYQIEKYILRAEKIYHLHLSPEMTQIKNICKNSYDITLYNIKRPIEDLINFKVLKLIGNGMVVLHRKEHNVFYMKVIQKSLQFSDSLYLNIPKDVPYMVKLFQYYDGPNAVFIVTQYISGGTLLDHIKQKTISTNIETLTKYSSVTFEKEIYDSTDRDGEDLSSDSSECSYSDLISDYTNKKNSNSISSISKTEKISNSDTEEGSSITSEYEAKSMDGLPANLSVASNIVNGIEKDHSNDSINRTFQRSFSEKSYTEEFSCINYIPPLYDVVQWAAQLLLAIDKLHKMGVVICDLNPDKLLLDERNNLMLTFVCNFREKGNLFFNKFDNTYYCAPEIFGLGHVTFAADWWSYGAIVFEILTGMSLRSVHPEGIYNYTILKIPKYVSPEGKSLIRQLLIYDPQGRLGCGTNGTEELKSHPFFMAIDWSQLQREAFKM